MKLPRVHCSDTLWVKNFDEITLCHTVKEIEANSCFAIFGKNSKIQNGRHFWGGENFWKLPRVHCSDTLWVENFDEIALCHTVKEIEANSCFAIFWENSKIQNGRHVWGGENFLKLPRVHCSDTLWVENFDKIALCHTVKEIEALLIYLINYSLIYEAITPKSNPIQAINPMNLHTKFQKARLNSIP